ncbi:hypothetical protein Tco_0140541, partial [Tanacetum coccineum]
TEFVYTKGDDGDVMFIEIVKKNDDSRKEEPEAGVLEIEQYNSLSDLEKEHAKSVYLRNEDDKRRGGQDDIGSRSAAHPTEHFVSSSVTLTPEHECHDESSLTQGENVRTRLVSDHFVVITSSSKPMDTDATTSPWNGTGAYSPLGNKTGASFLPRNETGAFSSTPNDGSPVDDFLDDADFLDLLNMNFDQHRDDEIVALRDKLRKAEREATDVCEIRMRVSELEAAAAAKSEEITGLNVQIVEQLGKVEVVGEAKMRAKFMVIQGVEAQYFAERSIELDVYIAELNHDMDTELYPHMMTTVAGLKWMIGHSLRLAVMKCGQSTEYRVALRKAISMAINKEFEAYDDGVAADYVAAVNELKNVSFPLLDQLEALKDSLLKLLMPSITLEGSHGDEDSTLELHKLQLILLFDALAASHARGEKRKKGASSSLEMGGPSVVMPSVSSQDTSLVVADYHISSLAIIDGIVSTTEPHDDLFDTTMLDKPVDL